jgi:hypothetical protein
MPRNIWSLLLLVALSAVLAGACAQPAPADEATEEGGPAVVEPIDGTDLMRVTLTEDAVDRIGIETVRVVAVRAGRTRIPRDTLLYDENGRTWVYTEPETDVFVRAEIDIVGVDGDDLVLTTGPPPEMLVVTVGAAELYGAELGVVDPE